METEGLENKPDAFRLIMEKALLGFPTDEPPASVQSVFTRVNCKWLDYAPPNFMCNETVGPKKKPTPLSNVPQYVISRCRSCKEWKADKERDKEEAYLRRDGTRKILDFRKLFLRIARDGFSADVHLCRHGMSEGHFSMSRDGESLPCPIAEKAVKIKDVCLKAINPVTESSPCEYLITVAHQVRIAESPEYKDVAREVLRLPGPDNGRIIVETDAKVIDPEKRE
jgi:hypothetical protein